MAVSFDCFGTLVTADRPDEPWVAVADELAVRDVRIPEDWKNAYGTAHREYERRTAAPLDEHVRLALASRGVEIDDTTAREVTFGAFDCPVTVRPGARDALASARQHGPVAICSNCSVPGLVERALGRADIAVGHVVTSVDCGWRKPHPGIFEQAAEMLGVSLDALVHVGDDARTDGGAGRAGATTVLPDDVALGDLPAWLDARSPTRSQGDEAP